MKNKYLFFALVFFVPLLKVSAGGVSITEIMYDLEGSDTGREWIEIYNNSGSSIDLTKYKFVESGSSHGISHFSGSTDLPNGEHAVITDNPNTFIVDYPNQSRTQIYDSSFSLSNDKGESLSLKDPDGNIVYEITYDVLIGANGDGKSLQFINSWAASSPSPMVLNSSNSNNINENKDNDNTETTNTIDNSKTAGGLGFIPYQKDPEMSFVFSAPKSSVVGINVEYKAILYGYSGERITAGKFVWNFGDGTIQEDQYIKPVNHIYYYPGNYTVSLVYRYNWYANTVAIGKFNIQIVDTPLVMKDYYDKPIPAIKIANTKDQEYNIGGYIIKTGLKDFTIPSDTFIGAKEEIILNLPVADYNKDDLKLLNPNGYIASEFISSTQPIQNTNPVQVIYKNNNNTNQIKPTITPIFENYSNPNNQNLKSINLSANAINTNNNKNYIAYASLFTIIVLAGGIIFYLKNKNNDTNNTNDYSLQDE